jgi:hypothetical protein
MKKNGRKSNKKINFYNINILKIYAMILLFLLLCTTFSTGDMEILTSKTVMQHSEKDIVWDATITFSNTGGQNDYVVFGEAPDANDGPPADSYDVVKPPAPQPPYIRTWLNDNLPVPYDSLWMDYRHYPSSSKTWNLTVHWMPSSGSSPTTITMAWNVAEIDDSEYTSVTLCTSDGTPLQNMLTNNNYVFSCPAYVPQFFRIIGIAKQYYLSITIQGLGTVAKDPDQQSYASGQVVTLTANPSTGWTFNHWAGDLSGSINPTTITMNGNKSIIANFTLSNQPPNTPGKPNGPAQGKIKQTYTYTAVTTDVDGDQISYQFDWGDGSMSEWAGPFESGVTASATHTWMKKGNYGIKVKAKDSHGAESGWSESLPITMPLSQDYHPLNNARFINLFFRFLQGQFIHLLFIQLFNMEV